VYPSGAALATACAATLFEPPGRFSTMAGWPHLAENLSARIRASTSGPPAGADGVMILIVRLG
jgi:hypothetical protein